MEEIKIGYIYKIVDNTNDNVYYGSTTKSLKYRLSKHKSDYNLYLEGRDHYKTSFEIIKNNNYSMVYLEVVPYKDIYLLHERERWYIENNRCVNKYVPNRSESEYIEDKRIYCNICNYKVNPKHWSNHLKSITHNVNKKLL